jgi:hypothetical protein
MASVYGNKMDALLAVHPLPAPAAAQVHASLGGALQVASKLPPPLRGEYTAVAKHAFVAAPHDHRCDRLRNRWPSRDCEHMLLSARLCDLKQHLLTQRGRTRKDRAGNFDRGVQS